jgi:hypothetical protein
VINYTYLGGNLVPPPRVGVFTGLVPFRYTMRVG